MSISLTQIISPKFPQKFAFKPKKHKLCISKYFKMTEQQDPLKALGEIRNIMERSSRFISLSGLSGVLAGIFALIGATFAFIYLHKIPFSDPYFLQYDRDGHFLRQIDFTTFFFLDAGGVLFFALASGIFLTTRKAKRKGLKIWESVTKRLLLNLLIPLSAGFVFCLALLYHGMPEFIAPATLVFYGLALINGSKYTFEVVRYLGLLEILLGLIAMYYIGYGLEFWTIGFGLLHIIYGTLMHFNYD